MSVHITKQITGKREETFKANLIITAIAEISFNMADGRDLRDVAPEEAKRLVEKTKADMRETIRWRLLESLTDWLEEKSRDGIVVTEFVKTKLLLVNPKDYKKMMTKKKREMEVRSRVDPHKGREGRESEGRDELPSESI